MAIRGLIVFVVVLVAYMAIGGSAAGKKNLFKQFVTIRIRAFFAHFQMIWTGQDVQTGLLVVKTLTVSFLINDTAPAITKKKGNS